MSLFTDQNIKLSKPLADRMKPRNLGEFVGQEEVIGEGTVLRNLIEKDELTSLIFWGPPGVGKTALAWVIANETKAIFVAMSAVAAGVKDVRQVVKEAQGAKSLNQKTILFLDEIHRFNKAQQDALLPYVEDGTIVLIGATTENPSFEVNSALLSRSRVFVMKALQPKEIETIINNALEDKERGLGNQKIKIESPALKFIIEQAYGDARTALNTLEMAVMSAGPNKIGVREVDLKITEQARQHKALLYDKNQDEHYNIISALHKSMRGSDPDAALYWLARMLEAGEDPLYVARRVIRFASEDVGNAAPYGLTLAVAAYQACHFIGMPECNLALAQAVAYLASVKKDNSLYVAYGKIKEDIEKFGPLPVPRHLRNAPTKLMKDLGYGKDYKYNPDFDEPVEQEYLPGQLKGKKYLK